MLNSCLRKEEKFTLLTRQHILSGSGISRSWLNVRVKRSFICIFTLVTLTLTREEMDVIVTKASPLESAAHSCLWVILIVFYSIITFLVLLSSMKIAAILVFSFLYAILMFKWLLGVGISSCYVVFSEQI